MFRLLRKPRAASSPPARVPVLPPGRRCYAIGDIHGRLDLLLELLRQIRADAERPGATSVHVVFLGDFVDRGPQSREVVDHLLHADWSWATPVFLRGNHEEVFHAALLGDTAMLQRWVAVGGLDTCESYGLHAAAWAEGRPERFRERLARLVPADHIGFLDELYDSFTMGDYLFVHAGIRPGVPLDAQNPIDLRWIREEFLSSDDDFGKLVVHGHTVSHMPEVRFNRIGIDTGAYRSGRLTALAIDGGSVDGTVESGRWFLTTGEPERVPIDRQLASVRPGA